MLDFSCGTKNYEVSPADHEFVSQQLGRNPRGLEAIEVRRKNGDPAVIRVASLVDGKPFPTLFWLVDPKLSYQLSQLEADGMIAKLQSIVDRSQRLFARLEQDHKKYIALRESYMLPDIREQLQRKGYLAVLKKKGIGGLGSFDRIRCLHTYIAAHLVVPNAVGEILMS